MTNGQLLLFSLLVYMLNFYVLALLQRYGYVKKRQNKYNAILTDYDQKNLRHEFMNTYYTV